MDRLYRHGKLLFIPDAVWVEDQVTDVCMNRGCRKKFKLLNGKHHCRWCGLIFCDVCAPREAAGMGERYGDGKKYRRCNACRLPIVFRSYPVMSGQRLQAMPMSVILSFLDNRSIHHLLQTCYTTMSQFHVPDFPYFDSIQHRFPTFFEGAQIGKGGSGTVYKCEDRQLPNHPRVALKVITKVNVLTYSAWRKILTELSILSTIRHENVAQLLDVFQTKLELVIVMEAGEGGALRQAWEFARKHKYDMEVFTANVIAQVSEGLDYLFREKHIIHRDIKSDNIVLSHDFRKVMIIDFGLAEYVGPGERKQFVPCGTMGFASPENILAVVERRHLFEASGDTMHRADMFSLGVVAYMMLSAQKPMRGKRFSDLYAEVKRGLRCAGPRWADVSDDAKSLIEWLLETKTRARAVPSDVRTHPLVVQKAPLIQAIARSRVDELNIAQLAEGDEWVYVSFSNEWNDTAEEDFAKLRPRSALVRRLSPLRLIS